MKLMEPKEYHDRVNRGEAMHLVDVRSPGEYKSAHAAMAINHPLETISKEIVQTLQETGNVAIICQKGGRSAKAVQMLEKEGVEGLLDIEGGTDAWLSAGLPSLKGRGVISIERQVRIGAGIFILAGVAGGFWVHPGFFGIPAFVGAGLIFAGITDWCGMGIALSKMPWNR